MAYLPAIQICPLCRKHLEDKEGVHIAIEVGHSRGGWGRRRDDLNFSDEVCPDCYKLIDKALAPLAKILKQQINLSRE